MCMALCPLEQKERDKSGFVYWSYTSWSWNMNCFVNGSLILEKQTHTHTHTHTHVCFFVPSGRILIRRHGNALGCFKIKSHETCEASVMFAVVKIFVCFYPYRKALDYKMGAGISPHEFLCAFAKLRRTTIRFVMSVHPSVRPRGTTRLPTGRILIKLDI
jgi:hypothetical protein